MSQFRGNNVLAGNSGKFWWNNEPVFEIETFEAKVVANREDVIIGNSVDSKVTSLKGEGTFKIKKVFSRGQKELLTAWNSGKDPRVMLVGALEDADAVGGQKERIKLDNVWFNELTLMRFEKGAKLDQEYSFGFTVSDAEYLETIVVQ